MSSVNYISQVALGAATAVKLADIFAAEMSGTAFAIKCVSGAIAIGTSNAVTAANGWPLSAGEVISIEGQNWRDLWAIGGAADRIAVIGA